MKGKMSKWIDGKNGLRNKTAAKTTEMENVKRNKAMIADMMKAKIENNRMDAEFDAATKQDLEYSMDYTGGGTADSIEELMEDWSLSPHGEDQHAIDHMERDEYPEADSDLDNTDYDDFSNEYNGY